jgi:hypothetical protein
MGQRKKEGLDDWGVKGGRWAYQGEEWREQRRLKRKFI